MSDAYAWRKALRTTLPALGLSDVEASLRALVREYGSRSQDALLRSSWGRLDAAMGLSDGDTVVVGAENNSGKSSMVLQWTLDVALMNPSPAVYISCEDQEPRVLARSIAQSQFPRAGEPRMDPRSLRTRRAKGLEAVTAERWAKQVWESRWQHANLRGLDDVLALLGALEARTFVVIDYLQSMRLSGQDRRNAIREGFTKMCEVSRQRGIILVVVSQIRRPKDAKPGWEPSKFDLKESSDIEDSADNVVMLWRPRKEGSAPTHCKVEKSKDRPQTSRWLFAQQGTDRFVELPYEP